MSHVDYMGLRQDWGCLTWVYRQDELDQEGQFLYLTALGDEDLYYAHPSTPISTQAIITLVYLFALPIGLLSISFLVQSLLFLHMVMRSSTQLHRPVQSFKDTYKFHPQISDGFHRLGL